jgi:hypothetical protein
MKKRYFEKDLETLKDNLSLEGNDYSLWMFDSEDESESYHNYFAVFTNYGLFLIPGSASLFSFEYYPSRMKIIKYNQIKNINIFEKKVSDVHLSENVTFTDFDKDDNFEILEIIDLIGLKKSILLTNKGLKIEFAKYFNLAVKLSK